jgi:hypothetical protein
MKRLSSLASVVLSLLLAAPFARAAEDASQADLATKELTIILKMLTYDRQLEFKAKGALTIGIVYNPADPASLKDQTQVADVLAKWAAENKKVNKLPLGTYLVEYATQDQLDKVLKSKVISVFYVCAGVKNLEYLVKVADAHQITTVTTTPAYVSKGVAVGVTALGERPDMLVNLRSAKAEGIEFEASLLHIVKIVGE